MSTTIKPVLSKKNPNYISKHRYYELKHFCLQYPEWRKEYREIYLEPKSRIVDTRNDYYISDSTGSIATRRVELERKMKLVEQTAFAVDPELSEWLLRAVTDGLSYETLHGVYGIPCCRETFYERYRRYFKLLSES